MNRYQGIRELRNINPIAGPLGTLYYKNVRYPEVPESPNDIWVITEWGDRLDILANTFYQDVTLYWIISIANPNYIKFDSLFIEEGFCTYAKRAKLPSINFYIWHAWIVN